MGMTTATEHRFARLARMSAGALVAGTPSIHLAETLASLSPADRAEARIYIDEHEAEELGIISARQERHERMQREVDEMDGDGYGM